MLSLKMALHFSFCKNFFVQRKQEMQELLAAGEVATAYNSGTTITKQNTFQFVDKHIVFFPVRGEVLIYLFIFKFYFSN